MNNWHKGILVTLVANIIWGIAAPMVKVTLETIPPMSLVFLRSLVVVVILFPIYEFKLLPDLKKQTIDNRKLTSVDFRDIFLAGFLGVFLNLALYFSGQKLTTVIDAFVIISMGTPILIIYSYFFLKERLTKIVYLGSTLAFIGTLVIVGSPIFSFGQGNILGNVLALGATISAIASFLIIRRLVTKISAMTLTFYFFLTSMFFSLPLFLWEFMQNPYWMANLKTADLLMLAYLVLGSSIAAYYLTTLGLKFIPPSIASTIGYSSTIVAVALGILFLGEKPTLFFGVGSVLIILGLLLTETRHRSSRLHKED